MTVLNRKEVEALVLLRDGGNKTIEGVNMLLDGINKLLETTEPKETQKPTVEEVSSLKTQDKTSAKGPYKLISKAENPNNPTFEKLQNYIKQHGGFVTLHGSKFWNFDKNHDLIGKR